MAKATKRKVSRARGNNLKKTVRRGRKLNRAVNHVKATKKRRKSRSRRTSRKVRKSLNQSGGVGFFREYMTASQIEEHLNDKITDATFIDYLNKNPQKPEGIILTLQQVSEKSIKITGGENINLEIKITNGIRFRDGCTDSKTYFLNIINEEDVETSKYYSVENLVSGIGSILSTVRHTSGAPHSRLSVRVAGDLSSSSAKPVEPVSPLTIVYNSIVTIPIYRGLERNHELITSLSVNKFILRINKDNKLVISYRINDGPVIHDIISRDDITIPSEEEPANETVLNTIRQKLIGESGKSGESGVIKILNKKHSSQLSLPESFSLQIVKKQENIEELYATILANPKDQDELAWKELISNLEPNPLYDDTCPDDGPLPPLPSPPTPPPRVNPPG